MDPNTHSTPAAGGLDLLATAVDQLAAEDLDALPDAEAARRVLVLRGFIERLEGHWLRELAGVDGRGAAGADQGVPAESTAGWLRNRTRMGHPDAHQRVRVARALHRGPLAGTARALVDGELSYRHAAALTRATQALPAATTAAAEPVLLAAARRLDPPRLRKVVGHLCDVADPQAADQQALRHHDRRGLWVSPTLEGMVAIDGLLDPEAGETLLTALEPLARPSTAEDERSAAQRNADALTELARRQLAGWQLPQTGGVRPQVTVTIELASMLDHTGLPGAEGSWVGPLPGGDRAAAGLRRGGHPGAGRPPPPPGRPPRRPPQPAPPGGGRQPRRRRPGRRAGRPGARRHDPAATGAWWCADPAVGGWACHPGGRPCPTYRPDGA